MENNAKNKNFWITVAVLAAFAFSTIITTVRSVPVSQEREEPPVWCRVGSLCQVPGLLTEEAGVEICTFDAEEGEKLQIDFMHGQESAVLTQKRYQGEALTEEDTWTIEPDRYGHYILEIAPKSSGGDEYLLFLLEVTEETYIFRINFL